MVGARRAAHLHIGQRHHDLYLRRVRTADPHRPFRRLDHRLHQSAQYNGVEKYVADRVKAGDTVYYRVQPFYAGSNPVPYGIDYVVASRSCAECPPTVVHVVVVNDQ